MSNKAPLSIPHGAGVLIADGRKALILRNTGSPMAPKFETIQAIESSETRETHEIGTDRPGRVHESSTTRRSAMEQTDFHTQAEQRFAGLVAEAVQVQHGQGAFATLVLVAARHGLHGPVFTDYNLGSLVEYVFPPFPGDTLVVLGAWYAVNGKISWPLAFAAVTAGAV